MGKHAFYVRVSTKDKQDYQRQIEILQDLHQLKNVKKNDIEIFGENESGYKDDRKELERLINKIIDDNAYFSCIYVTEISRLGRSPRKIRGILNTLEDCKVNLYIKKSDILLFDEDGRYNSFGRLMVDIMINLADEEVRTLKERTKSGILTSIRAGKINGGKYKTFGFKKGDNKMMEIDDDEAEIVQDIFDWYVDGLGTQRIANKLNEKEIKTRSSKSFGNEIVNKKTGKIGNQVMWRDKTVLDIIKNPIYIGERRYWGGKENRRAGVEPELIKLDLPKTIIDPELWEECQSIRTNKTTKNRVSKYVYLLKDLMVCGACGRNYYARFKPALHGDKVYICSSRHTSEKNCGNPGVNISFIESTFYNELISSDAILKYINNTDDVKHQLEKELELIQDDIKSISRQIPERQRMLESTLELLIKVTSENKTNLISTYEKIVAKYDKEISNYKERLRIAERKERKLKKALKLKENLKTTKSMLRDYKHDRESLKSIYQQLIHKIIINKVSSKIIMCTVYMKINDTVLEGSLNLFLDVSGMRKRKKDYNYYASMKLGKNLIFENNILTSPESLQEIETTIAIIQENSGMIDEELTTIPKENILTIPIN